MIFSPLKDVRPGVVLHPTPRNGLAHPPVPLEDFRKHFKRIRGLSDEDFDLLVTNGVRWKQQSLLYRNPS